jgi:ABC-type Fe3+-siderophore transport system permease subunit
MMCLPANPGLVILVLKLSALAGGPFFLYLLIRSRRTWVATV